MAGCAPGRVRRRPRRPAERWHHPAPHRHPRRLMRAVSRPVDLDAGPHRRRPWRRRPVRPRRRRRRRPRRRAAGWRPTTRPTFLAAIDHVVEGDGEPGAGVGPVAIGWVPYEPGGAGRDGRAGRRRAASAPTASRGSRRSTAPPPRTSSRRPRRPRRPAASRSRRSRRSTATSTRSRRCATPCAPGALTKAVIAREIAVTADQPIDVHGVLHATARRRSGRASATRSTGSSAPRPSCWSRSTAGPCARTRWPARRRAPATSTATAGSPSSCSPARRTRSSTGSSSTSSTTRCCPGASYLDWEPEPSIVTVANVQHLGTQMEGQLSTPRAVGGRAGPRPDADAGARRPPPGRGAGDDRRGRGRRPGPLRRRRRLGRRRRQRHVGGGDPLRRARARTAAGPACGPAAASSPTATR